MFVRILKDGAVFGDIGLLDNSKRSASVLAQEDTHCIIISKKNYELEIKDIEKIKIEKKCNFIIRAICDSGYE